TLAIPAVPIIPEKIKIKVLFIGITRCFIRIYSFTNQTVHPVVLPEVLKPLPFALKSLFHFKGMPS
ncbi:hypothetical protein, partial [Neisseria cinerea]|uniref:hypothetical protein n=1 Tax=Neisseria cinerea TaxID=483 RepID=UPI002B1CF58A